MARRAVLTLMGLLGAAVGAVALPGAATAEGISTITISDAEAAESGVMSFAVTRDNATHACDLSFFTNNGTAIEDEDFQPSDGLFRMTIGQLSRQIIVPLVDDDLDENLEFFTISVAATPAETCVLVNDSALGTILVDPSDSPSGPPAPPTSASASSSGQNIEVTWSEVGTNTTEYVVARYRWNGSAWVADAGSTPAFDGYYLDFNVPDGSYYYEIRSVKGTVVTDPVYTSIAHSTTTVAPAAPSGLTVASSGDDVTLAWTDNSDSEFGFELMRAEWAGGDWTGWTVLTPTDTNVVNATDAAVPPGIYAYLVRSYNAAGSSEWAIATISHPAIAPAAPTGFNVFSEFGVVQLGWTDSSSESYYELLRARYNPTTNSWEEWQLQILGADAVVYIDGNVSAGVYAYLLRAVNGGGASEWVTQVTGVDTSGNVPAKPTELALTAGGGGMSVSWVDNADDEWGYEVLRARFDTFTGWGEWTSWTFDKDTTSFNDTPLGPGDYAYLVRAYNGNGASEWEIYTGEISND